jgi:adenylate cyclase
MQEQDIAEIGRWLAKSGLAGLSEPELLRGFCESCRMAGLPLTRGLVFIDTLHPIYEGHAFPWRYDQEVEQAEIAYRPTNQGGDAEANWRRTVFFELWQNGGTEKRLRLNGGMPASYYAVERLQAEGQMDYIAFVHRFAAAGVIGEMDGFFSHWTTELAAGFSDDDLAALRRLMPQLGIAIKCASLTRIAGTLVEVYLGRDAGRRVLGGRITRGVADRIHAVLWFSDLRGYTTITDTAAPDEIIPLLNDYAEAVITSVQEVGGDVLKLIGDGTLAIFAAEDADAACAQALQAEEALRHRVIALNGKRHAAGHPVTSVYLGLHIGEVFYGNIGSDDRLDFTVVGPAVNEVSRIAAMCRSIDRAVLISDSFRAALPEALRDRLVSVGRYALRGIGRAQELFTIDPERL